MGGDVFAFPKSKDPADAQRRRSCSPRVMLEPETQIAFAQKKGSIPVRRDVDMSSLDVCAQKAVKLLADKNASGASRRLAGAARVHRRARRT